MDLPASYYGELNKRNPVISAFERDIESFSAVVRRVSSSASQDNGSCAKGIAILVEIWTKYKHRLPLKMYQERMLQIADFLFGIKLYQLALWQGYGLHLLQFSSVEITDVTDVDHFMACFFPDGFDTDQDVFAMKVRAMQGCALCIFEQEKKKSILSQKDLSKLLRVLNFIRIMMQAFQQDEQLHWQMYNGSIHIYSICRYLMTMNCSAQALEYLLWSSISLELSIPLMTSEHLPWIVTLYCAVCHCYYDSQAGAKAEEFARRALQKINELAKSEKQNDVPATRETQRAYKEASIKLAAMMFKRAVFDTRRRPKPTLRSKTKSTLKATPSGPWPRTTTERMLTGLFDSSAAQFLGILEALSDSSRRPLHTRLPDEPELQEVIIELLSAGIRILSGGTTRSESFSALTPTSSLMDLALTGESQVPITSAIRFIKLLFQYKQPDAFAKLTREMLHVLSGVEGRSFRKAELELALLDNFSSLLSSQWSHGEEDNMTDECHKSSISMSDEFIGLVETLHKSVCCSAPEVQPDGDLVWDLVIFLWAKVKAAMQRHHLQNLHFILEKADNCGKWLWCLSMLCEVAFSSDLANVDCIMIAEMSHTLATLLERAAGHGQHTQCPAHEADSDGVKSSSFSLLECSSRELCQRACEVAERGRETLVKGVAALLPRDGSAIADAAFMQKFYPLPSSTPSISSTSPEGGSEEDKLSKKETEEAETKPSSDVKSSVYTQHTCVYQLAIDLHFELDVIYHRASLKLLQLNAVTESELLARIKKNKASKALYLIQKALLMFKNAEPNNGNDHVRSLLEEAVTLIEKAGVEERKLYVSATLKTSAEKKDRKMREEEDKPPPAPILLSRTDQSFTFAPAPYNLDGQVCWYQLCGHEAGAVNHRVRLGDCSLPGTGNMVPVVSGECVLRVDGLEPNKKYVFAVAAYNCEGKLLGNSVGGTTFPLLASMPVQLLSTWAHLAQAAFQTEQYAVAKRAYGELWSHYTCFDPTSHSTQDRLAATGLSVQTLQHSSPYLCQLFLTSILIGTEINIQQGSLHCGSFSGNGPFIWEQEARLAECERMLVAMDLAMWMNDGCAAVQAAVNCYGLLAPLIFHQISCDPVIQVLEKCLMVLKENSGLLKQKWTGSTSESLQHMIACITYYLSKTLRGLREHQMASVVMDCGRGLLQEIYDGQLQICRSAKGATDHSAANGEIDRSLQMKALQWKNKKRITSNAADKEISHPLTGSDDPTMLYGLISNRTLQDVYRSVMKLRRKAYFIELAALLLQRTMEEGHPDLVLKWGQSIFEFLCRRDESVGLSAKILDGNSQSERSGAQTPKESEERQQNKATPSQNDTRRKLKKMPHSVLQRVKTKREMQAVETLLDMMSSVMRCRERQIRLRNTRCDESVWRSQLNYSMAQAHVALLYQSAHQMHGGTLQHSYSQLEPLCFSLAYSGILVQRDAPSQQSPKHEVASERDPPRSRLEVSLAAHKDRSKREGESVADDVTEESADEEADASQTVEEQIAIQGRTADLVLESFQKAALHLRRAMVLAHRGSRWTLLQCVCQTVWDQSCSITVLVRRAAQLDPPCPITADHLHSTTTALLVVATDLMMDMLNILGLWSVYDSDLAEEELESSLHFSAPLDDCTNIDLRWVRSLVLHTLERLHDCGKWETLAHFALVFNSYTREHYAFIITPLLVHAQRKLLERISSFGGPAVPQPHQVKTQKATGKEVTCRSYAGSQLLTAWTPQPAQLPVCKKSTSTCSTPQDTADLKDAEKQRSMSLVCVPLDVEDTLRCYRQALERKSHCLQVLQRSRSLLLLLLASKQPCFATQLQPRQSSDLSCSASVVDFSPIVWPLTNIQPCNLTEEDCSALSAPYSLPISPDHTPTVIAVYSTSIKYLQVNGHDSLRVLALHEMGNLQFYNENTRAANSYWRQAVDCALQSPGSLQKWDGMSFGDDSLQQTLKRAGIWGCLQAATLTAKIAQYILTSDISQRTKCCLLSAHLFKCVLCCSLAQPRADVRYACHRIGEQLLPGVDLFSEPHRVHLGTTVASLHFVCHWLFTAGYYITLLPILALYLHFAGTVCRNVQRTVEGKILQIRALTELCLFTEAVKESVLLAQGNGILLPHGHYVTNDSFQPLKTFHSNKSLLENAEVLEELVNCDLAPGVQMWYGPALCLRFSLARVQLVLALSGTIRGPHAPDSFEGEASVKLPSSTVNMNYSEQDRQATKASCQNIEEPQMLTFDTEKENLTLERLKFLLLKGASSLLHSTSPQLTSQSCGKIENLELTIESNLLKANLYLQQGHVKLSFEKAFSSLELLQTSPDIRLSEPDSQKPVSEPPNAWTGSEQDTQGCSMSKPLVADCSREVEASERIGVFLWLRCRLALVRSLVAHIPHPVDLFPGKKINEEAARVLREGLDECALWGDLDVQAVLMVEGAAMEAQRGKTDASIAMLQESIGLLSGRTHIPPGSTLTLARAALLLSNLQGEQCITLLKLAQKLLQTQIVVFDDEKCSLTPPGPCNIYLPSLKLLDQVTLRIGCIQDARAIERPVSTSSQFSQLSTQTDRESHAMAAQAPPAVTQPDNCNRVTIIK